MPARLAAAFLLLASCREATPARAPDKAKPELYLLTSLPLLWSENFGLDQPGSPALEALDGAYQVRPIDLPSQLPEGGLLLAAQPRALPAEELVALDEWVRRGGRILLLADPMLEWPSNLPLGDKRRPPTAYPDTGLLSHWGLALDAPEERGPRQSSVGGQVMLTASPGTVGRVRGDCRIADRGAMAQCPIGKGRAIIIADADFLNLGPTGLDGPVEGNLPVLLSQLASLRR